MNIAIFTDTFLPQTNGVVTATVNLAKGLADKGHEVHIIAPKFPRVKEFKYPHVHVKRVFAVNAYFYEDFKFTLPINIEILNYIIQNKIEVIHFTSPIMLGVQAILIGHSIGVPVVGTFHTFVADPQYLRHVKLNNKVMEKVAWNYLKAYYNRCDLVTSPSDYTKKELMKNGIRRPIKVISNGIHLDMFDNSNAKKVREKYIKDKNGKLLLFIGRVAHEKNIFYLLDCLKIVADKLPKAKLLIVGDGPQMEEVKIKIKTLGLSNNAIIIGKIAHEDLVKSSIFGACDLFVSASVTENQPMTILEAQANGLVCIGQNAKGVPDLIKNDYNGYAVKVGDKQAFADAIIKVLSNEALYKKMKQNTLKEIQSHDMSRVISVWEKTYFDSIRGKQGFFGFRKWLFRRKNNFYM
jgi:glycosyltransferase involved in cell wall biosynthesis